MSWRNLQRKFDLRRHNEFNKRMSWGRRIYFDHFLTGLWHFGELFLIHCTMSVHSPCLWTNFEGVGFISNLVYGEDINTYHWRWMKVFYFQVEFPYSTNCYLSLYSPIPSYLFPHTLMLMVHLLKWCFLFVDYIWCPSLDIWCISL